MATGPVNTHICFTDDGEPIIPPEARPQKTSKKRIRTPAAHLKNIRSKNYNSGRVKKRPLETRPRRPRGKSLCFIVRSNVFMISVWVDLHFLNLSKLFKCLLATCIICPSRYLARQKRGLPWLLKLTILLLLQADVIHSAAGSFVLGECHLRLSTIFVKSFGRDTKRWRRGMSTWTRLLCQSRWPAEEAHLVALTHTNTTFIQMKSRQW